MAYKITIKLASWKAGEPAQVYVVETLEKLSDLIRDVLGTRVDFNNVDDMQDENQNLGVFVCKENGHEVTIDTNGAYRDFEGNSGFEKAAWAAFNNKILPARALWNFLKKILNPFRWARHGLSFAALVTAIGVGTLLSSGTLAGLALLGVTVGLPMLLIAGLVETVLEYWQAKKDIQLHAYAGGYLIQYNFLTYLSDVVRYWGELYKVRAAIIGIGVVLFIAALIFTIPYCVDPTGSFSFMSAILDPMVHFFSQGIDALSLMPPFEFLSALQQPAVELALAGGLLISSPLAVSLTLKNFIHGVVGGLGSVYRYDEDPELHTHIDTLYNRPEAIGHLSSYNFYGPFRGTYYSDSKLEGAMESICKHERELVIR